MRSGGKMVVWLIDNGKIDNGCNVVSVDQEEGFRSEYGYIYGLVFIGKYLLILLGLYDMIDHGFEWARDWYVEFYDFKDLKNL